MITYQKVEFDGEWTSINKKVDGNVVLSIPLVADNTDYQEFLAWKSEGNEPEPADE